MRILQRIVLTLLCGSGNALHFDHTGSMGVPEFLISFLPYNDIPRRETIEPVRSLARVSPDDVEENNQLNKTINDGYVSVRYFNHLDGRVGEKGVVVERTATLSD